MKRNITFPITRLRIKPKWWLCGIFLSALLTLLYVYPESPQSLTVFDQNQHLYLNSCPQLAPTIENERHKQKHLPLPFSLLNWNIYKQQKKQWRNKLQQWTDKADLLTLQEVKYSPQFRKFSTDNNLLYLQNYAFKYNAFSYGVNSLSKYHSSFVCGTRNAEPWIRVPKTGLASIYPIANHPDSLLVVNLHGINFTFTPQPLIEQLQPYLQLIKKHGGPVIFSGDINTWSKQRLKAVENVLLDAGLKEARFSNDQRMTIFGMPLDHIYFRGLKVIKAESIATRASDHSPQLLTFDIE
jgi:endonuclease/exonuclease/phosphatase (EEP) superfamily protein YafD